MFMQGEGDTFLFVLAEKLHKTVSELEQLPYRELLAWRAYLDVQSTIGDLHRRTEEHRRRNR